MTGEEGHESAKAFGLHIQPFCCSDKKGLKPHHDLLGNLQTNEGQTPGHPLTALCGGRASVLH